MIRVNCSAQNYETNSIEKSVWRLRELTDMVRCKLVSFHKWSFFPWTAFSAGFDPQRSHATPAVKTLVRPCPEKKVLIYESDTLTCAHRFFQGS